VCCYIIFLNILFYLFGFLTSFFSKCVGRPSTVNPSFGNLEKKVTNISDMLRDRFMPYQRILPHTYLTTSKWPTLWFLDFRQGKICFTKGNEYQPNITFDVWLRRPILHKYANEDVTLGSWFIGLEVEQIDDRNFCCGTPPGKISSSFF